RRGTWRPVSSTAMAIEPRASAASEATPTARAAEGQPAAPPPAPGIERLAMPPAHGHSAPLAFWPAHAPSGGGGATSAGGGPAVLVLPALGVPAGAYRRLAEALAAAGTPTGVAEWRGGGASAVRAARGTDWGYLDLLHHEVLGGIAALRQRLEGRPVAIVGHSLGAHLGLMARAEATPGLAGVLTVAAGTPTMRFFAPKLRWQIRVVLAVHRASGPLLGYFPGHRIGFGGRQPRKLMDEWGLLARLGRFEIGGRNLLAPRSEEARRIPVHALTLPRDHYAPRAATVHLLELAGVGAEHIERFEGPGPLGHFDWLRDPAALAMRMQAVVAAWG
ncbi:MAG: alpha/beta hydrolase, partial [Rubrivivax sp.]|nr:alpha/beta hydrolase [Rubrivivax sp.]